MKKIIGIGILVVVLLFGLAVSSLAAGGFSVSTSATTVQINNAFTISITANNAAGRFNISSSSSCIKLSSTSQFADNQTVTITGTAQSAGTAIITITAADVTDNDEQAVTGSKTITINVPAPVVTPEPEPDPTPQLSNNANLKNLGINPNDFSGFRANNTTYYVTVPEKVRNVNVYANVQDSKASIVSGTGNREIKIGENTLSVTVKAEDGTTKTYSIIITRKAEEEEQEEKSNDANLKQLSLLEGILNPEFNSDVKEYNINVSNEISELTMSATVNNSRATYIIEGNKQLKVGENLIKVIVTAEDGTTNTYTINVNKLEKSLLELQSLNISFTNSEGKIKVLELSPKFNSNILEYTLQNVEYDIEKLDVEATCNIENSEIEILGNTELKAGKNIIKVKLTLPINEESGEEQETKIYTITVIKDATPIPVAPTLMGSIKDWFSKNKKGITLGALITCITALLGLSVYIVIDYKKYQTLMSKLRDVTTIINKQNAIQEESKQTIKMIDKEEDTSKM